MTSSQTTIHHVLSQSDDSEDADSQWTLSQSSQSCYEEADGDDFAEYKPTQIFQLKTTLAAEASSINDVGHDEPLTEGNSTVQNEEHEDDGESWYSNSSSPVEPNFLLGANDPEM